MPNIGSSQQFEEGIAPLNNPNDVGERTPIKDGFAVPMLVEKRDPRIPEFDEVKDKVAVGVKQEKAKSQLEQTAKDIHRRREDSCGFESSGRKSTGWKLRPKLITKSARRWPISARAPSSTIR